MVDGLSRLLEPVGSEKVKSVTMFLFPRAANCCKCCDLENRSLLVVWLHLPVDATLFFTRPFPVLLHPWVMLPC